jgi:hypothetical protein
MSIQIRLAVTIRLAEANRLAVTNPLAVANRLAVTNLLAVANRWAEAIQLPFPNPPRSPACC